MQEHREHRKQGRCTCLGVPAKANIHAGFQGFLKSVTPVTPKKERIQLYVSTQYLTRFRI